MRRGERVSRVEKEKKCRKREGKSSRVDRTLVDQFNILESSRDNLKFSSSPKEFIRVCVLIDSPGFNQSGANG